MRQVWMPFRAALVSVSVVLVSAGVTGGLATADPVEPPPSFLAAFGNFQEPSGVAVDPTSGDVLAVGWDDEVRRFSSTGELLDSWTWDDGVGGFSRGIAVDDTGNVYVADCYDNLVRKFTPSGSLLTSWGGAGVEPGEFGCPRGMAIDPLTGTLLVVDFGNNRVQRFALDGTPLHGWSGGMRYPEGVAVDPTTGDVLVVEGTWDPHRVWRFTADGTYLDDWTGAEPGDDFNQSMGIAVDGSGDVYVADAGHRRIVKLAPDGQFLTSWGSAGYGDGEFDWPSAVAVDDAGNVYVADTMNARLQKFGPRGRPDVRIRVGTGRLVGDDVYNTTGANQTRKAAVRPGGKVTYTVSVQNDSTITEPIALRGKGSTDHLTVVYQDQAGTSITRQVLRGTFRTPVLDPWETYQVKVVVTLRRSAPRGYSVARTLTSTSATHATARDTVRFVTRRS